MFLLQKPVKLICLHLNKRSEKLLLFSLVKKLHLVVLFKGSKLKIDIAVAQIKKTKRFVYYSFRIFRFLKKILFIRLRNKFLN